MKLKNLSLVFVMISGFTFGQNNNAEPQGIKSHFSQKSIEAYQENSENKLVEFYEYLTLYSKTKDEELKSQIQQNLYSLAESENTELIDFTNPDYPKIDLSELLGKIENQSYRFSVNEIYSNELGLSEWINQYELVVRKSNKTVLFEIKQNVKFAQVEKSFGSKSKTVWEMRLGDMNAE